MKANLSTSTRTGTGTRAVTRTEAPARSTAQSTAQSDPAKNDRRSKSKPEQAGDLLAGKLLGGSQPKRKRLYSAENSSLPSVDCLSDPEFQAAAISLLERAHANKKLKETAEQSQKDATEALAAIALSEGIPGLKYKQLGIRVRGYVSRRVFDRDAAVSLMLEHGISPTDIEALYTEGKEYLDARLEEFE